METPETAVEQLVMQDAKGKAVVEYVRALLVVPADVGGFDADRVTFVLKSVAAEGAASEVGGDDAAAEIGIALAAGDELEFLGQRRQRGDGGIVIESELIEQLFLQRFGDIGADDVAGDELGEAGVLVEDGDDPSRQAAENVRLAQSGDGWELAAGVEGNEFNPGDFPQLVALQVPEGITRRGLAVRSVFTEEAVDFGFNKRKGSEAVFAFDPARQGPKDEQMLVGRPFDLARGAIHRQHRLAELECGGEWRGGVHASA